MIRRVPPALLISLLVPACATYQYHSDKTLTNAAPLCAYADGPFKPEWESLQGYKTPEWFADAKFGIWAHWGPQSVPEQGDWYARGMYQEGTPQANYHRQHYGHPSVFGFKDIVPLWKAEKFDPERLMGLYKKAGAKYFFTMGVHHDNFDLWNSKHHKWNAVNMGPHKDIVGLWAKAARAAGLRFGISEHLERSYNWFNTNKGQDKTGPKAGIPYDGADPKYADFYHPPHPDTSAQYPVNPPEWWKKEWFDRVKDIVDSYDPDLVYTDGSVPFGEVGRRFMAHYYNQSIARHGKLDAVYFLKNAGRKEYGENAEGISVYDLERGVLTEIKSKPWQNDTSVADWFYSHDYPFKTTDQVLQLLADVVSKNGNLLMNFTQRPDGTLDPESEKVLGELGDWMPINGEAIFATRPWHTLGEGPNTKHNDKNLKYTSEDIRFTTKGNVLYAIILGWPGDGATVNIASLGTAKDSVEVSEVRLLGTDAPLAFSRDDKALKVILPPVRPCKHIYALKIVRKM